MKTIKSKGILVILIVSLFFIPVFSLSSAAFAPVNRSTDAVMNISNTEIHDYFTKIVEKPYNLETNNCKNKSEQLANYLVKHGATGVYTVDVQYKDNVQFHECIEWQGKIYDPTIPVYAMDESKYFDLINGYGLTGLKFISPYP